MAANPWIEAFAPATVSNLGPGFDCLGMALRGPGDTVRARRSDTPGVQILSIEGDNGKLPLEADKNTAGVGALQILKRHAPKGAGIEIELIKGLPLGSGLGSSGASACAAVVAVDTVLGLGLTPGEMIDAAREGERIACGAAHPDNVAPSIMGGLVLISSVDPMRVTELPIPGNLWFSIYTPGHPVSTEAARAVLPKSISIPTLVSQSARMGLLVHALHENDLALLGEAMVDEVAEPARCEMIPGYLDTKVACLEAGAITCLISGAGPTTLAISDSRERAETLLTIMDESFAEAGVRGEGRVDQAGPGARVVSAPLH